MTLSAILSASLFIASASDLATTRYVFHKGGYELNGIAGGNPVRQGTVSMSGATAVYLATRSIDGSQFGNHRKLSIALKLGFIASRVIVSANNVKEGRK